MACSYASSVPVVDFPSLDERIEAALGDLSKYFIGGEITAEALGPMFGGYGTFLPTYKRCPCPPKKTSKKLKKKKQPPSRWELQLSARRMIAKYRASSMNSSSRSSLSSSSSSSTSSHFIRK